MEENKKELKVIDVNDIAKKLWSRKKLFAKTLPTAFVVACIFILGFPRYYTTDIKLVPEMEGTSKNSKLSSLASSFGFNIDNLQTNDAITPLLYPDLMDDNGFVTGLFRVSVRTKDGTVKTNYHDYLHDYTKNSWWYQPIEWLKKMFTKEEDSMSNADYDPYNISKSESELAKKVRKNVQIEFDKKTAIISVKVTAQDPLVCKIMADSVKERLQLFITDYRTRKARIDYEYYKGLTNNAKKEYEKALYRYGSTADANTKAALKTVRLKLEDMENDLQLKYNTYTTLNTQMQAAKAKVQERTPAFTTIKGAEVPVKPAGPKRTIFVLAVLILTALGTSLYIVVRNYPLS